MKIAVSTSFDKTNLGFTSPHRKENGEDSSESQNSIVAARNVAPPLSLENRKRQNLKDNFLRLFATTDTRKKTWFVIGDPALTPSGLVAKFAGFAKMKDFFSIMSYSGKLPDRRLLNNSEAYLLAGKAAEVKSKHVFDVVLKEAQERGSAGEWALEVLIERVLFLEPPSLSGAMQSMHTAIRFHVSETQRELLAKQLDLGSGIEHIDKYAVLQTHQQLKGLQTALKDIETRSPDLQQGLMVRLIGVIGQWPNRQLVANAFREIAVHDAIRSEGVRALSLEAVATLIGGLPVYERRAVFKTVLGQVQDLQETGRAKVLGKLALAVRLLPDSQAVHNILDYVTTLSTAVRPQILQVLAESIPLLPGSQRAGIFHALLEQVTLLPKSMRAQPLSTLAGRIACLEGQDECIAIFKALLDEVSSLSTDGCSHVLAHLGKNVCFLPESKRGKSMRAIMDRASKFPNIESAQLLDILADNLSCVSMNDRSGILKTIVDAVAEIPHSRRAWLLGALVGKVGYLPENQRADVFHAIAGGVRRLPEAKFAQPLVHLIRNLNVLPEHQRMAVFKTVVDLIRMIGDSARSEPLAVLSHQIKLLPEKYRLEAFNVIVNVTQEAKLLRPNHAPLLTALAENLSDLRSDQQAGAFQTILKDIEKLPDGANTHVLAALAMQTRLLPENQCAFIFGVIAHRLTQLPETEQGRPLGKLIECIGRLPEDQRAAAVHTMTDRVMPNLADNASSTLLTSLAKKITVLPERQRADAFKTIVNKAKVLSEDQRLTPTGALKKQIPNLPPNQRAACESHFRNALESEQCSGLRIPHQSSTLSINR